jgi:hypothetical protein
MRTDRPPRHSAPRPYRPDTQADEAEAAATRKGLADGTLVLAPRADGWVEVRESGGDWIELPVLDDAGHRIGSWDTAALSRWMRGGTEPTRVRPFERMFAALRPDRLR